MNTVTKSLALLTVIAPAVASAQFTYSWNHPANWGSPQNGLSESLASFESQNLPSGMLISVSGATGGYGPTGVLPNLYNTIFDGSVYSQGRYDGNCALLNTIDNTVGQDAGDITFTFLTPVSSVGFSLGLMQPGARLKINGVDQGEFLPKFSNILTGEFPRQGYFRISGGTISSLTLDVVGSDAIVMDHMAYAPVPEPATLSVLGLGLLAIVRRKTVKS